MIISPQSMTVKIPKNARVFVVEDSASRIKWFREKLAGGEPKMVVGTQPDYALEELQNGAPFDIIFLDHDAKWNDPNLTFLPVAQRLAELKFAGDVIIHSYNPPGAKRMEHILGREARVIIAPFGSFDIVREA